MNIIAHRGNLNGPNPGYENSLGYIKTANYAGFQAEVDLWKTDNILAFGHDAPTYDTGDYLSAINIYHCKNVSAYMHMQARGWEDYFIHDTDPIIRTFYGLHWVHPNYLAQVVDNSDFYLGLQDFVAVLPEQTDVTFSELAEFGNICTDYPIRYKELFQ